MPSAASSAEAGTTRAERGRALYVAGGPPEFAPSRTEYPLAVASTRLPSRPRRAPASRANPRRVRHRQDVADAVNCVRQLVRGLRLAEQHTRAATGLSAAQLFVLGQLAETGAVSVGDLAELTLTDRSSVAAVVERLADAGLVATNRDELDRRRVLVSITGSGRRMLASAPAAPTEMLLSALGRMSAAEVRALCASVGRLTEEMGLGGPPGLLFEDRHGTSRSRA